MNSTLRSIGHRKANSEDSHRFDTRSLASVVTKSLHHEKAWAGSLTLRHTKRKLNWLNRICRHRTNIDRPCWIITSSAQWTPFMNIIKENRWHGIPSLVMLLFLGSQFVSCTTEISFEGMFKLRRLCIVNLKQDSKRYFLHWHGIKHEVHYPILTEDFFYAFPRSDQDYPESIVNTLQLPHKSKLPEIRLEVHIRLKNIAKNPFHDKIEFPFNMIKSIKVTDLEKRGNQKAFKPVTWQVKMIGLSFPAEGPSPDWLKRKKHPTT